VFERDAWTEISIGDFILGGGEIPAAALVDAVVRLLPGAMSDPHSAETDSFEDGLLDAAYYTRPEICQGLSVPEPLMSGHHQRIEAWRLQQRLERTRARRPDLWQAWLADHPEYRDN
ncbi:MAG: tRNA (guanosine(37)-N1)-methyltransferase TrmD, partial [bacterium]|nr:tRNA (guanosine(37)-N1)-methyltransferase TrmD [bacterium]